MFDFLARFSHLSTGSYSFSKATQVIHHGDPAPFLLYMVADVLSSFLSCGVKCSLLRVLGR